MHTCRDRHSTGVPECTRYMNSSSGGGRPPCVLLRDPVELQVLSKDYRSCVVEKDAASLLEKVYRRLIELPAPVNGVAVVLNSHEYSPFTRSPAQRVTTTTFTSCCVKEQAGRSSIPHKFLSTGGVLTVRTWIPLRVVARNYAPKAGRKFVRYWFYWAQRWL